ncbi:hypothetical protein JMUB6875_55880 [Nocardia sp. JMUB6875]
MSGAETARARCVRVRRRLLGVARCRYAEDRLADAVSAGTRQLVLFGSALDTFASHNPYPEVRVHRVAAALPDIALQAAGFDTRCATFAVHLGGSVMALDARLRLLQACSAGAEIVFDIVPEQAGRIDRLLRDSGWSVLEELDASALAARYLSDAPDPSDSREPRLVWARVGNNAGRLPNS